MATRVDCGIMEAVQIATGVEFESELVARERLRLATGKNERRRDQAGGGYEKPGLHGGTPRHLAEG